MSVTMRDVAQQAGVSIKTVSRVVNNQSEISPATREKVLNVIAQLGYRPNLAARSLVTQRTGAVGLVVGDITNPFFPEVARGMQDTAQTQGYNVFLCNTDEDPVEEQKALDSLAARSVDGLVIFGTHGRSQIMQFADHYRPIIVINQFVEHPNIGLILVDNHHGAKLAVDHLVERGHKTIGMIAGLEKDPNKVRRIQGFQDALATHNLPIIDNHIISGPSKIEHGYDAALHLLQTYPQITALFAYNDLIALGASQACQTLGRKIPSDCAIVGFDNIQLASLVTPKLTTIHTDKYDLGRKAMKQVLKMLNNPEVELPPINLDVELIVREST